MSEKIHKITRKVFADSPRFEVPRYQREYSWQPQQIDQLLSDIDAIELDIRSKSNIEVITNHFVGLLVFIDETNEAKEKVYTVVDGQQRLSTFVLIAAVAKDVINEILQKPDITVETATNLDRIKDLFDQYIYISSRPFGDKTQKLIPNNNDKAIYEILILNEGNIDSKKATVLSKLGKSGLSLKYFKAYQHIYEYMFERSKDDDVFLINFFVKFDSGISFIPFISESDTDAFNLFECLNDRGMRLSSIDLIKNKLLQQANPNELENIESKWSEVLGTSGVVPSDQAQSFIRNYLMIKHGHITKGSVYKICKDTLTNNQSAILFLQEISEYGANYRDILEVFNSHSAGMSIYVRDDDVAEKLLLLNKTKVKQWQSLALVAYTDYKNSKLNRSNLLAILDLLLKICIRFKILNKRFNLIEKPIPSIARDLNKSLINNIERPYDEVVGHCINELQSIISKHTPNDQLILTLDSGYLIDDNDLAFILLRLIAAKSTALRHGLTFSKALNLTLEHVLPEKHEQYWGRIHNVDELKYSIGNMLLIELIENVRLRNRSFADKKVIYANLNPIDLVIDPNLQYQNATQEVWITSMIKEREKDLISTLKSII